MRYFQENKPGKFGERFEWDPWQLCYLKSILWQLNHIVKITFISKLKKGKITAYIPTYILKINEEEDEGKKAFVKIENVTVHR